MTTVEDEHGSDGAVAPFARRAPRISQVDVFRAADELLVQGDRPTIDRVRMRLGRGSPNTINDHLDAWWAKLGARLRDLPGQEFPQLPQAVAHALQNLWNRALEGAHEALGNSIHVREEALRAAEAALAARVEEVNVRTQAVDARATALEDSLTLAREQLSAALHRTQTLEHTLGEREELLSRARTHAQGAEAAAAQLRAQLTAADAAHRDERARLAQRSATTESRWLQEVDRARQALKDGERAANELHGRIQLLTAERDQARLQLTEVRGELRGALTHRSPPAALKAAAQRPPKTQKRPRGGARAPASRKPPR